MKLIFYLLLLFFTGHKLSAQNELSALSGAYEDAQIRGERLATLLELKEDGTFRLKTIDYVYPQTFKDYINAGTWVANGKEVILNPELKKREPKVSITEKRIGLLDSIEIKINHRQQIFENQELIEIRTADFELMTLYFGRKNKAVNLLREPYLRNCFWAPRIKHQQIIDSTNTFRIAKAEFDKIGIYTYGFSQPIETRLKDKMADHYEIDIIVPIDQERMPRSKKVIIKGNRAYFYEVNGKVNTFWIDPLRKKKM